MSSAPRGGTTAPYRERSYGRCVVLCCAAVRGAGSARARRWGRRRLGRVLRGRGPLSRGRRGELGRSRRRCRVELIRDANRDGGGAEDLLPCSVPSERTLRLESAEQAREGDGYDEVTKGYGKYDFAWFRSAAETYKNQHTQVAHDMPISRMYSGKASAEYCRRLSARAVKPTKRNAQ